MGGRSSAMFAVAVLALTSCATGKVRGGPGSSVQLVVPDAMAWEPGDRYEIPVSIFNATKMMLQMAAPYDQSVEFALYKADGSVACKSQKITYRQVETWRIQKVKPLTGLAYKIDAEPQCKSLPNGVYRFEVSYMANGPADSFTDVVWTGLLGPLGGRVLISEGARTLKYEDLVAALDAKEGSAATEVIAAAAAASKATEAEKLKAATADPAAVRACVDKELSSRSLNAYADPPGTSYPNGPPTDEDGRVLYVASRNPAIRKACGIAGF